MSDYSLWLIIPVGLVGLWLLVLVVTLMVAVLGWLHPAILYIVWRMPFELLKWLFEWPQKLYRRRQVLRISEEIISRMRAVGIYCEAGYGERMSFHRQGQRVAAQGVYVSQDGEPYCQVFFNVPPGKEDVYRRVVASMVKKYGTKEGVGTICAELFPLELLDREWARQYGFDQYYGPDLSHPCDGCETVAARAFSTWGTHTNAFGFPVNVYRDGRVLHLCPACKAREIDTPVIEDVD